jgi:hypothetical protein
MAAVSGRIGAAEPRPAGAADRGGKGGGGRAALANRLKKK